MLGKQSMQEKSPHILRGVSKLLSILEKHQLAAQEQPARPQIAVFITHGMGQQVPFETIDSATEGLAQAAARKGCHVSSIRARTIQIDGIKTQHTEFDMRNAKGRDVEVHVYEGYWAPITEGNVTLRDIMSFLYSAGFKGLWNCRLPFERWIFGGVTSFGNQIGAGFRLLTILAVLLSLVVRQQFIRSAAFLIEEMHVDGLRVDLTQAIHRDNALHADGRSIGNANVFGSGAAPCA